MEPIKYINNQKYIHVGSRQYLCIDNILYLEADLNYCNIYLKDGKRVFSSTTLKVLERRLDEQRANFFRVNRQYMVNMCHATVSDADEVSIENKINICFSRRKKQAWQMAR